MGYSGISEYKRTEEEGYSLKEIGELTPFFYPDQVLDKKKSGERKKKPETAGGDQKSERIPSEFMDIISRLVVQRLKEQDSEEARYKDWISGYGTASSPEEKWLPRLRRRIRVDGNC